MLPQITLAATAAGLDASPSLLDVIWIVLIGFSFVVCVLLIFSLLTSVLGKVFAGLPVGAPIEAPSSPVDTEKAISVLPAKVNDECDIDESDPRIIAVIAAAIHCATGGRKHRIVSIRSSDSTWAAEGRRQIFSSRNVR